MSTKRNLICAALIVFSAIVLVSVLLFNYHPRGKPIRDLKKDEKEVEEIISTRSETDKRLEAGVLFNGIELPYDEAGRSYYYSLPENSPSAYTPEASVKGGVRLAFLSERITDEMIAAGEPLEAIVYNSKEFSRIKIVCTTLPVISLSTKGEISSDYSSVSMRVYDNRTEATKPLEILNGKIHTRGNTSLRFDKKAYRISLRDMSPGRNMREYDVSLLGMRKDGDWILYAAYNDQERVRNVFSTNLWYSSCGTHNSFGIDNGVEYRFVELLINDDYAGLYALGYPLDKKQLRIGPEEYTYQKITAKKELTLNYSDYDELAANFEIKEGDTNVGEDVMWKPLADYYTYLQGINSADQSLYSRCDMGAATDVFLFINFVQGRDNSSSWGTLNLDQTLKIKDGERIMLYTPWDLDQSFGNVWSNSKENWITPYGVKPSSNRVMKINPVYMLMMYGDEGALKRVKNRYADLRQRLWSEDNLNKLIDRYEKQIFDSGAYARDVARWPGSTKLEDPSVKLSLFREHVMNRLTYMDEYVENLTTDGLYEEYEVYGK